LSSLFFSTVPAQALTTDIVTDRARYSPNAAVLVSVSLVNGRNHARGTVSLACTHLASHIEGPPPQVFRLAAGATTTLVFRWRPPPTDFQGYLVQVRARDSFGRLLGNAEVAVDVSSTWTKFPRYGFLSGFPPQTVFASRATVKRLGRFHLNALQFYDWQFKHQCPLAGTVSAPAPIWADIAGRPTARRTVLDLIAAAHAENMAAMNYNLLYGAWAGYGPDGVDFHWGLWKNKDGKDQDYLRMPSGWATPSLYLFNPGDVGWQRFLIAQEAQVFAAYPFDGWQIDQVGERGEEYDYAGHPVTVWETFRPFLNAAKAALRRTIVFNNVGAYGLYDTAAGSTEDAAYIECWESAGQKTYADLKTTIEQASAWSGGKAVILAAYNDRARADASSAARPGRFNSPGVRLTDAVIFAAGGAHIEIGDDCRLLDNEYFPNRNLVPSADLTRALGREYDFLTAYENLLRGGLIADTRAVTLSGGTVWAFAKSGGGFHVLHLINLTGEKDTLWRDDNADKPAPTPQTNLAVRDYADLGTIKNIYWASPDRDIVPVPLPFTRGTDGRGPYVSFTLPRLDYWDMVFMQTAASPATRKATP